MASALAVVVTQKAMATLCQQRRPPLPRRTLNPSPASGASHARPKAKKEHDDDDDDDDDDDEISFGDERPPPPKERTLAPATAAATAPTKKQPPKAESGSDVEMADDAQPRSPPKQKKSTLATKDPDLDSGDDLVRAALEKGKGKATQSQTSKRRS
jgi:DNA topoisomerase-2